MPRKSKELTVLALSRLKPGVHAVGGVSGLSLQVLPSGGGRSWVLRFSVGSRRRAMGLGPYPDVTLAKARDAAREARDLIRAGTDPIAQKKALQSALSAAQVKAMTFKQCAEAYIEAHKAEWSSKKHVAQWKGSLKTYCYPVIGELLVCDVEEAHVFKILEAIWTTKTQTAKRLRGRIENILDWATARKLRNGENPARWKGLLKHQLGAPSKIAKVEHFAALPVSEVGAFMKRLREIEITGARAVEFLDLTAARLGEVKGAVWDEIKFEDKVWIIPAERMKAKKEHRVPLTRDAIKLLEALPSGAGEDLVFPASRGGQLADAYFKAVLQSTDANAVCHGFRSTFRDWAGEMTAHPREVIEHALAHQLKDKAEAAYARGTQFEKRRVLMADWAAFCAKTESGTVIPIKGKKAREGMGK
jgi:integrase